MNPLRALQTKIPPQRDGSTCLASIGTGVPALKDLATETEKTAQQFHRDKSVLNDEGRYYRFNVVHGLEELRLEESKKTTENAAATRYVESQAPFGQMKTCANNIARRQC
jgi:hypothetical protein